MKSLSEKNEFIKNYFKELEKRNEKGYYWRLVESVISDEDIHQLEEKYNIVLPEWYQVFISTYYHVLLEIKGKLTSRWRSYDNEEDKVVSILIPQQSENEPLKQIDKLLNNYDDTLLSLGYLPIGDYEGDGPVCFDLNGKRG